MLTALTTEIEGELISRAQDGDREAFGEIVLHYHQSVVNVVYRMCGDTCLAEDAAQTAFLRAWENLPKYRPKARFRSWLYRIAINAALDMQRREVRLVDLDEQHLASTSEKPDQIIENHERRAHVKRAVQALPEASRAVLILREYEGLSYREIAETLDIPTGTVMSRLNYARSRLAKLLSPYLEES